MAGKEDKKRGNPERSRNQPGNQTPDTPSKERTRGHSRERPRRGERKSSER